nr:DUF84 family protein [Pullulanibacillus pueri]
MRKIGVGSSNPAKIKPVERFCASLEMEVFGLEVPSGVSDQPIGDRETLEGAKNRAQAVLNQSDADIGIGLEGGVTTIGDTMYVCNWGALVDREGRCLTASGAGIALPQTIAEGINAGRELGDVIDDYTSQTNVKQGQGTIGILTNGRVTRDEMFYQIIVLLFGQLEYHSLNS